MKQRIQKLIAGAGYCSRRAAETLITQGRVKVNGTACSLGDTADDGDTIEIDGKPLASSGGRSYIMLNKPRGYVTTMSDERGRKTVAELVSGVGTRVFPVGRLDMESEGLLIMTDDGLLASRLMHPSHSVEKTYMVRVRGDDILKSVQTLRQPLIIDGRPILPAKVAVKSGGEASSLLLITITEGRNRQIRKMCAQASLTVLRLKRVSVGSLKLGSLPQGQWRYLLPEEIDSLQKLLS